MAGNVPSADDIRAFGEDGAICLRGVFSQAWIDTLSRGVNRNLASPSQFAESLATIPGTGSYFNDYCNWKKFTEFKDFAFNSNVGEIAGKLMQSMSTVFYHEHVLVKEPGTHKETPWHHDQAYYPVDGDKNVSFWIPLDPVPMETTIEFVRGSHRGVTWYHPRKFATGREYMVEGERGEEERRYVPVPDIEADRTKYDILRWEVQPGDCVAFHMRTLHGAPSNRTNHTRRVVSFRWLGDDAILARRPWGVSPPILGGLNYGERVVCEEFPMVWQQA